MNIRIKSLKKRTIYIIIGFSLFVAGFSTSFIQYKGMNFTAVVYGKIKEFLDSPPKYEFMAPTVSESSRYQIYLNSARTSGTFTIEETVKGSVSKATGIVKYANTSYLMVANTTGSFVVNESISGLTSTAIGSISELNNIDLQPNSGKVLYYRNIQNIQRTETSKETVKLYINF